MFTNNLSAAGAGDIGDVGWIPGLGSFPGGGHDNPLQYSCLENPMDRGAWLGCSPWGCKESDTTKATEQVLMQSAGMTRNSSWKKFYIVEGRDVDYFLPLKKF